MCLCPTDTLISHHNSRDYSPLPPGPGPPLPHYNTAHYCPYNGSYLDPVELMLCVLLALSESPRLTTFLPARLKFLSL